MNKILILAAFLLLTAQNSFATVQITKMTDFAFGTWSGSGQLQSSDTICVYDSQANANYGITATGSGAASAFTVTDGTVTVAYTAEWQGSIGAMTALTTGVKSLFSAANSVSTTCAGGTNATLRITVSQADLLAAEAGSYTGTVTILLTKS